MEVNVIHKNEYSRDKANYLTNSVMGGITGYALKYALPLASTEKDEIYSAYKIKAIKQARASRAEAYNHIRSAAKKDKELDTFVKLYDSNKLTKKKIQSFDNSLKFTCEKLLKRLSEATRQGYKSVMLDFEAITKQKRPNAAFIGAGIGMAFFGSAIYNIIQKVAGEEK